MAMKLTIIFAALILLATPSIASVSQPRPGTDAAPETRKPITACDPTKPQQAVRLMLFKMVEGRLVPVAVFLVPKNC